MRVVEPWKQSRGSIILWRFGGYLSAGLRVHSHLSGGLRLRNYRTVEGNHKFSSRFSVFACFCGGHSNRVKRLRRLSGNFILLEASPLTKVSIILKNSDLFHDISEGSIVRP